MTLSQNDMGRAFEYSVALAMAERLPADLTPGLQLVVAKECFKRCSNIEQQKMVKAAREVAAFLVAHDTNLSDTGCVVRVQSDRAGQQGDVRDIVVTNHNSSQEIGISAKNRHYAVKHSRLSEHIDFGSEWFGVPCSSTYFDTVRPIFRDLHARQRRQELWRNIPNKKELYYQPVLQAFQTEMRSLFESQPQQVANRLIHYLLGRFDFYKVIKENGTVVSISSFNLGGSLGWGTRLPIPTSLQITPKPDSDTTLFMVFNQGWQISFRIHNASSKVEPSLKFDVAPVGFPSRMSRHSIDYDQL
jgi:hypothetical protein